MEVATEETAGAGLSAETPPAKKPRLCEAVGCQKHSNFGHPGQRASHCKLHSEHGMVNVMAKRCQAEGCNKLPSFGWPRPGETCIRCKVHMEPGMICPKRRYCDEPGCNLVPSYGNPDEKKTRCSKHALPGMEAKSNRTCCEPGCTVVASYGWLGSGKTHCRYHLQPGQVRFRCRWEGCKNEATFRKSGQPSRCREHAEPGMTEKETAVCEVEGCQSLPQFGYPGASKTRCKAHALPGMEIAIPGGCRFKGCTKMATYGPPNSRKTRCGEHKEPGMWLGGTLVRPNRPVAPRVEPPPGVAAEMSDSEGDMESMPPLEQNGGGAETLEKRVPWLYGPNNVHGQPPTHCRVHAEPGMERQSKVVCTGEGCNVAAGFGKPGGGPSVCKLHAHVGMVNLRMLTCCKENCTCQANFGWPTEGGPAALWYYYDIRTPAGVPGAPPEHCKTHAEPGMVPIEERLCQNDLCDERATYGWPRLGPSFCSGHALRGMEDVLSIRRCLVPDCGQLASYGVPGKKTPGTFKATKKKCKEPTCSKAPHFAYPGCPPERCKDHILEGMENVVSRRCLAEGCMIHPVFGHPGDKRPSFCRSHASADMVNVVQRSCDYPGGCNRPPKFGWRGHRQTRCAEHVEEGMDLLTRGARKSLDSPETPVRKRRRLAEDGVRVIRPGELGTDPTAIPLRKKPKQCGFNGCSKVPTFGWPRSRPQRCAVHKEPGMEDVVNAKCEVGGCRKLAHHAFPTDTLEKPRMTRCFDHCEQGMLSRAKLLERTRKLAAQSVDRRVLETKKSRRSGKLGSLGLMTYLESIGEAFGDVAPSILGLG